MHQPLMTVLPPALILPLSLSLSLCLPLSVSLSLSLSPSLPLPLSPVSLFLPLPLSVFVCTVSLIFAVSSGVCVIACFSCPACHELDSAHFGLP